MILMFRSVTPRVIVYGTNSLIQVIALKIYRILLSASMHGNYIKYLKIVDRMGFEPTTFAGSLLTQCECVIQTRLDDRSTYSSKYNELISF